jgi:NAD(P)-dependent dehydrogenase (short-subunit alcohol dehydrogenase family)
MGRLKGKIAIITGGAKGLGEADVRLFIREGARRAALAAMPHQTAILPQPDREAFLVRLFGMQTGVSIAVLRYSQRQ